MKRFVILLVTVTVQHQDPIKSFRIGRAQQHVSVWAYLKSRVSFVEVADDDFVLRFVFGQR